jgi:hypothetical protein
MRVKEARRKEGNSYAERGKILHPYFGQKRKR